MKQLIRFVNSRNEDITFEMPIFLAAIEGLSENYNSFITYKGAKQDGETYDRTELEKKQITITFNIVTTSLSEYMSIRDNLIRVFNPKLGPGILHYSYNGIERAIRCVPDGTPSLPIESRKNFTKGSVILVAFNPFLTDYYETAEKISTWTGGLKFKFSLPFSLKSRGATKVNIVNKGHVETPVEIIFKGPAENPKVMNLTTGEFIKVNRTLDSDDTLIINTEYGKKSVIIETNGVKSNAFNYIDLDSEFFNLQVGDNLIEYKVDSLTPTGVEIRYKNRYLGV